MSQQQLTDDEIQTLLEKAFESENQDQIRSIYIEHYPANHRATMLGRYFRFGTLPDPEPGLKELGAYLSTIPREHWSNENVWREAISKIDMPVSYWIEYGW